MNKRIKTIIKILIVIILLAIPIAVINYEANSLVDQNMVKKWSPKENSAHISAFFSKEAKFSENDILALEEKIKTLLKENDALDGSDKKREWADCYSAEGKLTITIENSNMDIKAIGVGGDFFLFHPLQLVSGSYFLSSNVMQDLVVVDEDTAWRLYGSSDIAGKTVEIGGVNHIIAGVIKRDEGKLNKEAGNNKPTIYVSYNSLKKYGEVEAITSYEVVMPNLTKEFARKIIKKNLEYSASNCEIIENSNRYSVVSLCKNLKEFGKRSMKTNSIQYPYWENVARGKEDICMLFMALEIIFVVASLIYLVMCIVKFIKKYGKKIKEFLKITARAVLARLKKKRKVNTVIFDIGNVLAEFIPMEFLEKLGYSGKLKEKVYNAVIENDIWNEYDSGIMTEEEVIGRFINRTPELEKEIKLVFSNLNGIVRRFEYTDMWIENLKEKGVRVLYLSNISKTLYYDCEEELDFIAETNGGILSFEAKCIKPDSKIYEMLVDKYNLIPEECVFVDDRSSNIEGAKKKGFRTILFESYEKTNEELENILQ